PTRRRYDLHMAGMMCAAVLGDLVDSRRTKDRAALHARFREAIERANAELQPRTPLRITVGDEYQGAFDTVGQALRAALWLRLQLLPLGDLRHGIGWGEARVLEEEPRVEDGPAWRSEEHTSELQSRENLVCRLLLEQKK